MMILPNTYTEKEHLRCPKKESAWVDKYIQSQANETDNGFIDIISQTI